MTELRKMSDWVYMITFKSVSLLPYMVTSADMENEENSVSRMLYCLIIWNQVFWFVQYGKPASSGWSYNNNYNFL